MDKKTTNTLLTIASVGLLISALILLVVQIFGDNKNNTLLVMAFLAIILANIFNVVRSNLNKKEK